MENACECLSFSFNEACSREECADWVFGVRWTPEAFLKQAVQVGHLFSNFSGLPTEVREACVDLASMSYVDMVNNRCSKLGEWVRLMKNLQQDEQRLKSEMPARRRILEPKKLLLMRHLQMMWKRVFRLWGKSPNLVLPKKLLPAVISEQDLCTNSQKTNQALRYMTRSSGDSDQKLWDKTVSEVEKGWMVGPLPWTVLESGALNYLTPPSNYCASLQSCARAPPRPHRA